MLDWSLRAASLTLVPPLLLYRSVGSPRKGFRCAHAVLHGPGSSCSDHALRVLRCSPIHKALPAIRRQFGQCREAVAELRMNHAAAALAGATGLPGLGAEFSADFACCVF